MNPKIYCMHCTHDGVYLTSTCVYVRGRELLSTHGKATVTHKPQFISSTSPIANAAPSRHKPPYGQTNPNAEEVRNARGKTIKTHPDVTIYLHGQYRTLG